MARIFIIGSADGLGQLAARRLTALGAQVTGRYFHHKQTLPAHPAASDVTFQDAFRAACEQLTGVRLA